VGQQPHDAPSGSPASQELAIRHAGKTAAEAGGLVCVSCRLNAPRAWSECGTRDCTLLRSMPPHRFRTREQAELEQLAAPCPTVRRTCSRDRLED